MEPATDIPLVLTEDERAKVRLVLNSTVGQKAKDQKKESDTPTINSNKYLKRFSNKMYPEELDEVPNLYRVRKYLWKYLELSISLENLQIAIAKAGLVSPVMLDMVVHTMLETPCFAVKSIQLFLQKKNDGYIIKTIVFCN